MRRPRAQTLTIEDNINLEHEVDPMEYTPIEVDPEPIIEEVINPEPIIIEEPKVETTRNLLEVVLNDTPIEIINLATGYTNTIVPKVIGKIRLVNSNLYRIPITNKNLNVDDFYVIKHYSKYSEHFRIVSVSNGRASIAPIVSGLELKNGDVIGELI